MIKKVLMFVCTCFFLVSCTGTGQYQSLNSKLYACGYPKSEYAIFHDCMKDKVSVSKDPTDYYSVTARAFLNEMAHYRELVNNKDISNSQAMDGISQFVAEQALIEKEATQRGAAISAGLLLGVGAVACVNNGGCGSGGGGYYQQPLMCSSCPSCSPVCNAGKACGNSCISVSDTCHVGRGSACNLNWRSYP